MTDFKIEKSIPTPEQKSARQKYPFHEMEVGDSFVVDYDDARKVQNAMCAHAKKHNRKFTARTVENGKVRVWRIE